MRVVINKFGVFGVSRRAIIELVEMNSSAVDKSPLNDWYGKDRFSDCGIGDGYTAYFIDGVVAKGDAVYTLGDVDRSHPDLLAVIDKLGVEVVSGELAELSVVEIPDGTQYEIQEYDGNETIHECHRVWG